MMSNTTSNPFQHEGAVPPDRLIGREKEVNIILDLIANPARGSSAIAGEQGIGKTSLLSHISAPAVSRDWGLSPEWCSFIKIDCQTITSPTKITFWSKVLDTMERSPFDEELRREYERLRAKDLITGFELRQLFDKFAEANKLIVLLLDDFHWIIDHVNPDKPDLLNTMRSLINRPLRGLSIVITTPDPLDALCNNIDFSGSPFQTSFAFVQLGPFTWDEANELIDRALASTEVRFTESDRRSVYEASKGHPARLQKACYDLFENYAKGSADKGS